MWGPGMTQARELMAQAGPVAPQLAWLEQLPACVVVIVRERIVYANAAALELMEAEAAQALVGQEVAAFIHPLDLHRVLGRLRHAEGEGGVNPPTEFRALTCRGRQRVLAMTSNHVEHAGQGGVLAAFLDMSERAAMERRLRETDENFQRIMNTMQDVFYRTDAQGITRYVCPAVKNVLGYEAQEIIGLPAAAFYPDMRERDALIAVIREQGFVHDFPGRMRRKDGVIIDISISTQALRDEQGQYAGVEGIWRDITSRKALERELERMATHDDLTGLPNRRDILEQLERALERRRDRRAQSPLSVLILDLDHFKRINDGHGHAVGDRVLRQMVAVVEERRRGVDRLGRLGGEEFLLILEGSDAAEACRAGERIRQGVEQAPMELGEGQVTQLTVSIGCAQATAEDRRASDVLERADRALYQAKRQGRNRVSA